MSIYKTNFWNSFVVIKHAFVQSDTALAYFFHITASTFHSPHSTVVDKLICQVLRSQDVAWRAMMQRDNVPVLFVGRPGDAYRYFAKKNPHKSARRVSTET